MAGITFEGVTKQFPDGTVAVDNISLDVPDGEFMILVGPSGCGKTTALRMVAGLEEITSGEIVIGDRVVNDLEPKERDVAMVFQNYALYPHMTVRDNIAFPLKMQRVSEDRDRLRAWRTRPGSSASTSCCAGSRGSCRAASASASRWAARSSATRRRSSWTSRSRTSTRSSACRCAPSSSTSTAGSA